MTPKNLLKISLIAIAGSSLVAACADEKSAVVNATKSQPPAPKTAKPSAALRFSHTLSKAPEAAGDTGILTVRIEDNYQAGALTLAAKATAGVELFETSKSAVYSMADKDAHEWDIYFRVRAGGTQYIDIVATAEAIDSGAMLSSYSAAVKMPGIPGDAEKPVRGEIETTPAGRRMIILPAEETIED